MELAMASKCAAAVLLLFLLNIVLRSYEKSLASSPSYIAAVVEHAPFAHVTKNSSSALHQIVENYKRYMKEAAEKEADIVVFPGYSTQSLHLSRHTYLSREHTTVVPEPELIFNPCSDTDHNVSETLRSLSCAARQYNIYVVFCVLEVTYCEGSNIVQQCSEEDQLHFGTIVAMDRKGTIVGKYRGPHLIGEPLLTRPSPPRVSTFDTDFGVKFGIISGVGILFPSPSLRLVNEFNIADIVFMSFWRSELPFLTALQVQSGWSRTFHVNLLAVNHISENIPYGGSGIFDGRSGTRASCIETNSSTLLLASLDKLDPHCAETSTCPPQKNEHESDLAMLPLHKGIHVQNENMKVYKTISLSKYYEYNGNIGRVERNFSTCHGALCCDFEIKMKTEIKPIKHGDMKPIGYLYRIAIFDGVRSMQGMTTIGIDVCAIMACSGTKLSTCGHALEFTKPHRMKTVFEKLVIKGIFSTVHSSQMPTVLDDHLRIIPAKWFRFKKQYIPKKEEIKITMYTTVKNASLFAFGIYGRDFEGDGTPQTTIEPHSDD